MGGSGGAGLFKKKKTQDDVVDQGSDDRARAV